MKKNLFLLVSFFLASLLFSSFEVNDTKKINDEQDEIAFKRIGGTTRSTDAVLVEGFADRYSLTVSVENYTGNVLVQVIGGRSNRLYNFDVYEVGAEIFSISTLRSGTYTVRITLDSGVYEGTFYKATYGR